MANLTVTEVNRIIKYKIKEIPEFRNVAVMGEITNFNERNRYGHWYFALKDAGGQLSCNLFMNYQKNVSFEPVDGMKVVCFGYIDVYEKSGIYQLYVTSMQEVGKGDSKLALEELKKKLTKEGIFDVSHKKSIPKYPNKIGIVTSESGAAFADLTTNIERRWTLSEIVLAPSLVQGEKAPADIVKSISLLDSMPDIDVIIVGRGGGANDDLNAFNSEAVARAVYNCNTPIISAVGHEVDFTLCDAAADIRVPTPSTAAEVTVPDKNEELRRIDDVYSDIKSLSGLRIEREEHRLSGLSLISSRNVFFDNLERIIEDYKSRMINSCKNRLVTEENRINRLADKINALSPQAVLKRGYTLTKLNGKSVNSVKELNTDDKVEIVFYNGIATADINEVNEYEQN